MPVKSRVNGWMKPMFLTAALLLAGCATQDAPPPLPNVYAVDPIRVHVAKVEMMDLSQGQATVPDKWINITGDVRPSPAEWVQQWAKERLVPAGQAGMIRVVVHKAQLIRLADAEVKTGMQGWFHEPMSRMQLEWEIGMKYYEGDALNSQSDITVSVKEAMRFETSEAVEDVYVRLIASAKLRLEEETKRLMQQYFGPAYGG